MKKLLTASFLLLFYSMAVGQQSDFLLIKKRNNRTLKTYYPGSFISAETYDGFRINGTINAIRNDSIIFTQRETRLFGTEFGSKVDTVEYALSINYRSIRKFNFSGYTPSSRKRGWAEVTIPKLLIIGGTGFIALEAINTIYRKESFNSNNKLLSFAIAGGVAASGFLWNYIVKHRNQVGGKYKAVYMKAGSFINESK